MDVLFGDVDSDGKSFAKLETDDGSRTLYVLTGYSDGAVSLAVSDGAKTWMGRVSPRQLGEMARKAKMEIGEFTSESLKALTCENVGDLNFVYSAKLNPSGSLELAWKKHLISENIKFQLGVAVLDPSPSEVVHSDLLGFASGSITSLREQISSLQKENERLDNERRGALNRLEKYVNIKEDVENDLYGKFKLVLNEKKAKIRRLMDQLLAEKNKSLHEEVRNDRSASRDLPEKTPPVEEGGDGTDDEICDDLTPPPRPKRPPSGSTRAVESLLGGDVEVVSPPVRRRKRQGTKKATKQPDIPR